jgi:predicted nucleic-acid-binding Zn-ribbon protein
MNCPKCSNSEIEQHSCLQDSKGNWLTKKDRYSFSTTGDYGNIHYEPRNAGIYQLDKTWLTCEKCKYEFNDSEVVAFWAVHTGWSLTEEIGIAAWNPRALAKIKIQR